MPLPIRLRLLGCALVAGLALSACGGGSGGGTATAGDSTASTASSQHRAHPVTRLAGRRCQTQVGGFISSMDSLRRRLAVGLAYEAYVHEVEGVRAAYRRIPTERLAIACLNGVGAPGERGFDVYIDAANAWGECVGEAGCGAATVEPVLQRKWRVASGLLSEAQHGLRELGAG